MPSSDAHLNPRSAAADALALTGRLIDSIGPRPSGSDASRQAADALAAEAAGFADRSWTEDFAVHPGAFLGWIRILVLIYVAGLVFLWLEIYWPAALLATAGLIIMVVQFFFYRQLLDPLFPRQTGRNVLATVEPEGEVRGHLIISGHHDSAHIFNFLAHQPELYALRVTGGIVVFVLFTLTSWVLAIWGAVSGPPGWSAVAAAVFSLLLLLVGQLWWFASKDSTPGAGDNLASTAAAWQALRHLAAEKAAGRGLRNLRVTAASWDAEEAGLRGARAWIAGHHSDDSLPIWNLNLECLYDIDDFFFLTSDVNGTVQLSAELADRGRRILAGRGRQVPAKPIAFLTGGTDAGELARGGAKATTLIGMPWGNTERSSVYHTPRDVLESVSPEAVAEAIYLSVALAGDLDQAL